MKYIKSIFILFIGAILIISNLTANQSFDSILKIKETSKNGEILFKEDRKISLKNEKIVGLTKYNNILTEIITEIKLSEKKYLNKELYSIKNLKDSFGNDWTISITITNNDESVTSFISVQDGNTIEGWINRNNKDLFGFRVFNF